jgi:hypothetical protein
MLRLSFTFDKHCGPFFQQATHNSNLRSDAATLLVAHRFLQLRRKQLFE